MPASTVNLHQAAIPRSVALNSARVYRMTPAIAAGVDDRFLSGEITVEKAAGATLKVDLMMAASSTATGASGLGLVVGTTSEAFSGVIRWSNVPVTAAFYYFRVTYTETVNAAGYRVFLDDLLILPSAAPLSADNYPGYFDGSTNGSDWDGDPNASTSTYYGGGRRAYAEVRDAIDMTSMAGGTRAEFTVNLAIPSAFWEDLIQTTITQTVSNAEMLAGTTYSLDALLESTAPIDDAVITVVPTGTVTGLVLTDAATGATLSLSGNVPGGGVVFDCGNFTAVAVSTGASVITNVTRAGSNGFLPITPLSSTQAPSLGVKATGSGSLTITVVARRRYLIA